MVFLAETQPRQAVESARSGVEPACEFQPKNTPVEQRLTFISGLAITGHVEREAEMRNMQQEIGYRIQLLRDAKRISQEELAEVCGLNRSFMGQIERGETNFTLETLRRVGTGLEVSLSALLKGLS